MLVTLHNGKSVAAFVFRMTCVTFYPIELHFMFVQKRKELFPQVNIKGRFFIGFYPAFFLPAVDPAFCNAVDNIFAVGSQNNTARFFEGGKPCNYAQKLHTVVSGSGVAAGDFFFDAVVSENDAETSRSGIAAASSIGKYFDCFDNNSPLTDNSYILYPICMK